MDSTLLTACPLFVGLSSDDIASILSTVPYQIKRFQAGSLIILSGAPVKSLSIVIRGTVKGEMVDIAGRIIKIEDIPAPNALASAFLFGNKNNYPVNVVCIEESELLTIEKADFLKLLMSNDKILVNFLNMISNRSQFLSEKIKFLNFKTIKGKLAHYILQKAGKEKTLVKLEITQNELAEFFGVARPSVARALGEMEVEGYIVATNRKIEILDKDGLGDLTFD